MSWSTKREIQFLRGIGSYGKVQRDPKTLLKRYIKAAKLRVDWGDMDGDEVIKTAKAMLGSM